MKKFGAPSAGKYGQVNGTASSMVIPVMTAVDGVKNALSMRKSTTTVSAPISLYLRNLRSPAATATLAPAAEPTKTPNVTRLGGISIHAICSLRHSTRVDAAAVRLLHIGRDVTAGASRTFAAARHAHYFTTVGISVTFTTVGISVTF